MENGGPEFVLVQFSTASPDSYKGSQDKLHTDDFNMTLVVYNLCSPYRPTDKVLHLKYYLILTSKGNEPIPKLEDEPMLGKFRSVASTGAPLALGEVNIMLPNSELNDDVDGNGSSGENDDNPMRLAPEERSRNKLTGNSRFMHENVNYLGYYSPHEQSMLQLMMDKSKIIQTNIRDMISKGKCSNMFSLFQEMYELYI